MNIKERLASLLAVKSIVTLLITLVFAYLSIKETISSELFMQIFIMIISFYFGTQTKKEN